MPALDLQVDLPIAQTSAMSVLVWDTATWDGGRVDGEELPWLGARAGVAVKEQDDGAVRVELGLRRWSGDWDVEPELAASFTAVDVTFGVRRYVGPERDAREPRGAVPYLGMGGGVEAGRLALGGAWTDRTTASLAAHAEVGVRVGAAAGGTLELRGSAVPRLDEYWGSADLFGERVSWSFHPGRATVTALVGFSLR